MDDVSKGTFRQCIVITVINLKQALNQRLFLIKVHRVIKFNQKVWLEPYIDMNTELRKMEKMIFKLMNNAVFMKAMENGKNIGMLSL